MTGRDIALSILAGDREERGRIVTVEKAVMARNDEIATSNRERFRAAGALAVNVLSSPGSGKTTLLVRTLEDIRARAARPAVIVGDLATDRDGDRLRATGADTVQIRTGALCHLEADMITRAVNALGLDGRELVLIENVGNLVCPAGYDLGEELRVVLFSTPEGEDKPLKYPRAFRSADVVVLSKIDLIEVTGFDRASALEHIGLVAPQASVIELSARSGQGLEAWYAYLEAGIKNARRCGPEASRRS